MVAGSFADSVTDCADVYVPPDGDAVVVGGVVSMVDTTVIINEVIAVLPWLSVAVHVTGVSPTGNNEPDKGSHEMVETFIPLFCAVTE